MERHCIIMPLYNDWASAAILVPAIDRVVARWGGRVTLVIVDDGSQEEMPPSQGLAGGCGHLDELVILPLQCNQGHQRAIAVGLAYAQSRQCFTSVFVMDSDGEDTPEALNDLYATGQRHPRAIITADRASRSEGVLFRLGYGCYRLVFRLLTGTSIRFGNFCHIPSALLDRLVHHPDLWNSLSGCIQKSVLPKVGVPTHRATRYAGPSKMNIMGLILHGLNAISVFQEVVMVRLMILTAAGCLLSLLFGLGGAATGATGQWHMLLPLFWLQALLLLLVLTLGRLHHRAHHLQGPAAFWQEHLRTIVSLKPGRQEEAAPTEEKRHRSDVYPD